MNIQSLGDEIEYSYTRHRHIRVSELQRDGFLLLRGDPELWIQNNSADLLSVRFLELRSVDKIGDSIGKLSLLTHLSISYGVFKCLPNSISSLPYLQRLEFRCCTKLQELPADLGDLKTLTSLSLEDCSIIKSLPRSIQKLAKLTSLHFERCGSLKELPAISNVVDLSLYHCHSIQSLPIGLCNLKCVNLSCYSIHLLADFIHLPSLCHLTFRICGHCPFNFEELPANLGELSQLLTLNIQDTTIKWLPRSITQLSKLRLLSLPECFRLETLPKDLNDSVIIFVKDTHIRKTWKELKTELKLVSIPIVGEATHSASTPGYLHYRDDPGQCIQSNGLHSLVQILDLELPNCEFDTNIINSIGMLPELTHLYITNAYLHSLPLPLTKLTHLSLFYCDLKLSCDSLAKLSTLQSLTLLRCRNLPKHLDLPVSLTNFALEFCRSDSIPDSHMASIRKLSNLRTLNLSGYEDLELSQLHMNLTKLMLRDCKIKSLPRCVQHLVILHLSTYGDFYDHNTCFDELEFLYQVVNLRTLSVTCRNGKALPNIPGHQTLQELQLKECFKLKNLPSNLDEFIELHTLNVSGTRIKSLPRSITRLQNLQHLILPKCFIRKSLLKNLEDKVRVFIDDTDDIYYQHEGYNDSSYDSSEDDSITSGSTEGGDEVVSQELRYDINIDQASSQSLLKPLPDATQVHEGSHLSSRAVPIDNGSSSSQNFEMTTAEEVCAVLWAPSNISSFNETNGHHFPSNIWQTHANPTELEGTSLNAGRIGVVGESSSNTINIADYLAATPRLISPESQQGFHSGGMNIITSEHKQRNYDQSFDWINIVHAENDYYSSEDGQDKNPQCVDVKDKKIQKIDISKECIQECMSKGMTLECAAKECKVSRSTMKRRLKEVGMTWSKNKRKRHWDAKNKAQNTKSLPERNSSQPSLVDHTTADRDHGVEHMTGTGSYSTAFDVKATYKEDTIRIANFSLSSSIEQLREEVGKKHELEVGKFKMKYKDTADEWIKFTAVSELVDALYLSEPCGKRVVRLLITSVP